MSRIIEVSNSVQESLEATGSHPMKTRFKEIIKLLPERIVVITTENDQLWSIDDYAKDGGPGVV